MSTIFDGILIFVAEHNKNIATMLTMQTQVIHHLVPGHPKKPAWMIESQTDLFCLELSNSTKAAAFWQHEMLPRSGATADLSPAHAVSTLAVVANLQALRSLLCPAHTNQTLEDIFQEAMHQHEELSLPPKSAEMLAFSRLHLRPNFANSLTAAAPHDLAVTTAYALLKFGLQGCTTDDAMANKLKPPCNKVQVIVELLLAGYEPPTAVETTAHGVQTENLPLCIPVPPEFTQRILH
jgi:hypothetical protein